MTPMTLYLCQHGDALDKTTDPDRPLSRRGADDVRRMAAVMSGAAAPAKIVHSGKTRARQTAEIFRERLAPDAQVVEEPGLGPNDAVEAYQSRLAGLDTDLMVAGHMPFVGGLASRLLGSGGRELLLFEPGAVAALNRGADGNWRLAWMLTPSLTTA